MLDNPTPPANSATPPQNDYQSIRERLNSWHITLTNALNPAILPLLQGVGYDVADINNHIKDVDTARKLNEDQAREYGEFSGALTDYETAQAAAHKNYVRHVGLARLKFRQDKNALIALDLVGERERSQGNYVLQALNFYNNGQKPAYQPGLAAKGMTATVLQAGATAYLNLQKLLAGIKKEKGEAQGATNLRDKVMAPLEDWMMEFKGSARIALEGQGQLLEQLGIKEGSEVF